MKKQNRIQLLIIAFIICPFGAFAQQGTSSYLTTHFQWKYPGKKIDSHSLPENGFNLNQGRFNIIGPKKLQSYGEKLVTFLNTSEEEIAEAYGLQPGPKKIIIGLFPLEESAKYDYDFSISSKDHTQLSFPFPVGTNTVKSGSISNFAVFSLLHTLIKVNLAFGSGSRYPISSHAFRFVDGLSGFLALETMVNHFSIDQDRYLRILDTHHLKTEESRRYSPTQLLSQNSSSESTDILAGLNQFFSGISLTQDSESVTNLSDTSSTADRIKVFQLIRSQYNRNGMKRIIQYLSRDVKIWDIEEKREDSSCRHTTGIGCMDRSIDGARADIILQYSTGKNFAQLLRRVRTKDTPAGALAEENLPEYPVYGFDYPQAGGANESVVNVLFHHNTTGINAGDIFDTENITMTGTVISLGIMDEAYQAQLEVGYSIGEKSTEDDFVYNSFQYSVPKNVTYTDLQIGTRILEKGNHTKWVTELGVFFHWKRLQTEWDMSGLSFKNTDLEYINCGYFLLDIQNYKARKFARKFDVGIKYDFQIGLVNQSGSTRIARDEKFNIDFSNLILGLNLGPEIRLRLPSILLDIRLGAEYNYLYQPLDDEGGKSSGDNTVNATLSMSKAYATIGLSF